MAALCLVVRVDVDGQLLVSAAQILDECVPGTDHSRRSRFRPHIGRNRVFAPVRCQKAMQVGHLAFLCGWLGCAPVLIDQSTEYSWRRIGASREITWSDRRSAGVG
jgi:hypothetical protein